MKKYGQELSVLLKSFLLNILIFLINRVSLPLVIKSDILQPLKGICTGKQFLAEKSAYQGCGKELADGYDDTVKFFHEMHRQTIEILNGLSDEDLNRKCLTPPGNEISIWKWLRAMIEHEIHHRGELYIYLNLLDVKTPQIYGFSAEEVQDMSVKQ